MKKVSVFVVGVSFVFGVFAGGEINWTGGGDGSSWTDGRNWGGSTPGEGDTAVIPDQTEVVVNGSDAVAALNALAGITMQGDGSVLCISNMATDVSLTVPISGKGVFITREQASTTSYNTLDLAADNSGFTGIFCATNAGLKISHDKALGGRNGGALHIAMKKGSSQRLTLAGGYRTLYNDVHITGVDYGKSLFIAHNGGTWYGNVYIYGGMGFHANSAGNTFRIAGDVIFKVSCNMTFSGGAGQMQYWGKVQNPFSASVYGGNIDIGGEPDSKAFGNYYATGTIKCFGPNLFAKFVNRDSGLRFGNNSSMTLDMNGYDQRLFLIRPNSKAYIKSLDKPVTLTIDGGMSSWNQELFTTRTDDGGADMLQGHVSYVYNPTNVTQHWCYGRLQNMHCTTDGGLTVMKSRFVIADTATFSNLTALVACGTTEYLKVESEGLNPVNGLRTLAVTNTAKMVFKADMTQKTREVHLASTAKLEIGAGSTVIATHRAYLDGALLPIGVYGKKNGTYADGSPIPARFQLACLTGDGYMDVQGPKGLALIVK